MHINYDNRSFKQSLIAPLCFILLIWSIHLIALMVNVNIHPFGIVAQKLTGLLGVLFAPLIHGGWGHLFSNSLPLIVLGTTLFYGYPKSSSIAIAGVWLISGVLTWVFARQEVVHFGASGLTHGLMFFLFVIGIMRRDKLAIALAMMVFFLFGGMIWGIFPNEPGISFEMHLFGAVAGVVMAMVLRKRDKPIPTKTYDWDDDDDLIGDEWKREE